MNKILTTVAGIASNKLFTTVAGYAAEQLLTVDNLKRLGTVVRTSFDKSADKASDATQKLDRAMQGAKGMLSEKAGQHLAGLREENQRNAIRLGFGTCLGIPVSEQLQMLEKGRHAEVLTTSAAKQRNCPLEVQQWLAQNCTHQRQTMLALAAHPRVDLGVLHQLAQHPELDIRARVADHIGPRMRLVEPGLKEAKARVYNTLVDRYESEMAGPLVPVCQDPGQIMQMYKQTRKTPENAHLFVQNPHTPSHVLEDISTTARLRIQPHGSSVVADAQRQLEKRHASSHDYAP